MKRKSTLAVATTLLILGLSSTAVYADTVNFSLANLHQTISGQKGGTLTYVATVSAPGNNVGTVFLNGDSFNVFSSISLDDSGFIANFPLSLSPGDSFTGDLFTLSIPAGSALGTYPGFFTILGGADNSDVNTLGIVNYSVTVTPEPSSLLLLGTGLASTFTTLQRRRFRE